MIFKVIASIFFLLELLNSKSDDQKFVTVRSMNVRGEWRFNAVPEISFLEFWTTFYGERRGIFELRKLGLIQEQLFLGHDLWRLERKSDDIGKMFGWGEWLITQWLSYWRHIKMTFSDYGIEDFDDCMDFMIRDFMVKNFWINFFWISRNQIFWYIHQKSQKLILINFNH